MKIGVLIDMLLHSYWQGYNGHSKDELSFSGRHPVECWEMGKRQREIDDAVYTLQTYGRGRITDSQMTGFWIQIDHDQAHIEQLQAAVAVLEQYNMIEHHPRFGNPRNVRIIDTEGRHHAPKKIRQEDIRATSDTR